MKYYLVIFLFLVYSINFSFFSDELQSPEINFYLNFNNNSELITREEITLTTNYNNENIYKINLSGSDGGSAKIELQKKSLLPISVVFYNTKQLIDKEILYLEDKIQVKLNNGQDEYIYQTNKRSFYDINSLFHLIRGFPLEKKEITFWLLIPEIRRGLLVYAKNLGSEIIQTNKNSYNCYKIELGVSGIIESTFFPHKYYFWITDEENREFVQFQGKDFFGQLQRTINNKFL
jgi:hypothetical protein